MMPHGNANVGRVNLTRNVKVGSESAGNWRFCYSFVTSLPEIARCDLL